ncbi:MAG TPA: four-carbon acid sugar kinase family protein [Candidatus Binatia bacterium]|jgi:uncharacterized protein YgbK (DUF1537 family)
MTGLQVIADDVTGACDVGAELAAAGVAVRVAVDGRGSPDEIEGVEVVNTQSRAVRVSEAYARVLRVTRGRPVDVLLKKIDTALRGHLGAELDAAIDGLGATAAFVAPAIPAVGRVTRGGCQWFGGRPLAETEFATDPEGVGAESSVAAVLARESRRRTELIALDTLRAGGLGERVRTLMGAGADLFVLDAESDADLLAAVRAALDLPGPLCLAGSIGVAAALARTLDLPVLPPVSVPSVLPAPALIVSGSLHSMAAAQLDAVCDAYAAERLVLARPELALSAEERAELFGRARAALAERRSVVLGVTRPLARPDIRGRRAVEHALGGLTRDVLRLGLARALVLVGGETTHAVLGALGATALAVYGRIAPLVTVGAIGDGEAAGLPVIVKGGSGGDPDVLRALLRRDAPSRQAVG